MKWRKYYKNISIITKKYASGVITCDGIEYKQSITLLSNCKHYKEMKKVFICFLMKR